MANKTCQAAVVRDWQQRPMPVGMTQEARPGRQGRLARAVQTRGRKQMVLGTVFVAFLAAGWVYPLIGYFIPVCMLLGIGLATWQGRTWCDWLCPRGSFADAWLARVSPRRAIPEALRRTPARVGVMAILMSVLTIQLMRLWPDPWAIGGFFVLLLTITTAVGVGLGLIWQQRSWCYLCPIGTMSSWVGKNRRPLALAAEACVECGRCQKHCPMQLSPAAMKDGEPLAHRGDCLKCGLCAASCPTGALAFTGTRS